MLRSSVRTPKLVPGGLALAALLCWAPISQATVYTGSATDPGNDLGPVGDLPPDPAVDFTNVVVKYDDVAGRVDVSYTFNRAPAAYQDVHAGVGLGSVLPSGDCSAPFFISLGWRGGGHTQGEAVVEGRSTDFAGTVQGTVWDDNPDGESWSEPAVFDWPRATQTWNFATSHASLAGRPYTCVSAAISVMDGSGGPGHTSPAEDWLDGRTLELKPAVTSPSPTPPIEPPAEVLTPSAPAGSSADEAEPSFTQPRARRALRRALAERFGNSFRNRDSFAVSCTKKSASRWSCAVRWRHGQYAYRAKVKLTMRPDGRVASRVRASSARALQ